MIKLNAIDTALKTFFSFLLNGLFCDSIGEASQIITSEKNRIK